MTNCDSENCQNIVYTGSLCVSCTQRKRRGYEKQEQDLSAMLECSVSHCVLPSNSRQTGSFCDPHYQLKYRGIDPESRILRPNDPKRTDKKCWVPDCPKRASIHSLCNYHEGRAKRGVLEVPDELGVKKNPPCQFEGCEKLQSSKGLCHGHYNQVRDGRELSPLRGWGEYIKGKGCAVDNCINPAVALGLCNKHITARKKYKLDIPEMSRLYAIKQCENTGCTNTKRLHIDHDHATGKVRGMLCSTCNTSLGMLGEDIERILGLAEYKKLHG